MHTTHSTSIHLEKESATVIKRSHGKYNNSNKEIMKKGKKEEEEEEAATARSKKVYGIVYLYTYRAEKYIHWNKRAGVHTSIVF